MTSMVLFILAAMWAVVLIPPYLRNRNDIGRSRDSVGSFKRQLNTLGSASPVGATPRTSLSDAPAPAGSSVPVPSTTELWTAGMPRSADEAERRRRDILRLFAAAAALTLVVALFVPSTTAWLIHLVVDVAGLGYFFAVQRLRQATISSGLNVAPLYAVEAHDEFDDVVTPLLRSGS